MTTHVKTPEPATSRGEQRVRWRPGPFAAVWFMTAALFAVSPLIAPGSLSSSAMTAMLPFAAVLMIAALGQSLVIAHGGIDLSVPGAIALAAVFVTKVPDTLGIPLEVAALLGLIAGVVGGVLTGLLVVHVGIAAFVATLAMNSILIGAVLALSKGFPGSADPNFSELAVGSVLGVPNLLLAAVLLTVLLHWMRRRTVVGRRFMAVGASVEAARLVGIRTGLYQVGAYAAAGLFYALAGMLLAGFLRTPDILLGDTYQLSSIAAVVLGGSLLTGGISNALATALAALFLTQLNQVVLAAGAPTSMQMLVQAGVLALAVSISRIPITRLLGLRRRPPSRPA
jgi:ribose transport system permease protein